MNATAIVILLIFALSASFLQRITGFGYGIIIMTVLPHVMPSYGEATAVSGLLAIVLAFVTAWKSRSYLTWSKLIPILATFLVVSFFAVLLVKHTDSHLLRKILGVVLILVSIYFFLFSGKIHMRPTLGAQVSMGSLSGIMGGLFAMQGPPVVVYFISTAESKEEYIALTQWYFFIGNIVISLYRAGSGFVTPAVGKAWLMILPTVFIGEWIGEKVYARMNAAAVKKGVYAFLALAGVVALLS